MWSKNDTYMFYGIVNSYKNLLDVYSLLSCVGIINFANSCRSICNIDEMWNHHYIILHQNFITYKYIKRDIKIRCNCLLRYYFIYQKQRNIIYILKLLLNQRKFKRFWGTDLKKCVGIMATAVYCYCHKNGIIITHSNFRT